MLILVFLPLVLLLGKVDQERQGRGRTLSSAVARARRQFVAARARGRVCYLYPGDRSNARVGGDCAQDRPGLAGAPALAGDRGQLAIVGLAVLALRVSLALPLVTLADFDHGREQPGAHRLAPKERALRARAHRRFAARCVDPDRALARRGWAVQPVQRFLLGARGARRAAARAAAGLARGGPHLARVRLTVRAAVAQHRSARAAHAPRRIQPAFAGHVVGVLVGCRLRGALRCRASPARCRHASTSCSSCSVPPCATRSWPRSVRSPRALRTNWAHRSRRSRSSRKSSSMVCGPATAIRR